MPRLALAVSSEDIWGASDGSTNGSIYTQELGGTISQAYPDATPEPSIATFVGTIIQGLLSIIAIVFLVLTIYAGVLWMTAAGNGDQVKKAQHLLRDSVIGLIIILSSYTISYAVLSFFTRNVY